MRTILMVLLSAVLALIVLPAAASEAGPAVSLSIAEEAAYGGLPVSVVLTSDHPMPGDTELLFADSQGNAYTASMKRGETETAVSIGTTAVAKHGPITYTLLEGDGYQGGAADTVVLYPLPQIEFYQSIYIRKVNSECLIAVTLKRNTLQEDGEFELRDQNGETLAVLAVKKNTRLSRFYFKWTPDEAQTGRHDLSVWFHGMNVSANEGYLAMAGTGPLVVHNYDVREKFIALSLDCAHQWAYVDDFLKMLDRQDVKVTFFMTGFGVQAHPDAVQSIQAHGHELANHSYWHYHMGEMDDLLAIRREIRSVNDQIEALTGVRPTLFRPPYGSYSKNLSAISRAEGCEVILWTNDAMDWVEDATADSIYRYIVRNPAPGNIILAHILNRDTVEAMDRAIAYFKEQGYRLGTVSALAQLYAQENGKDQ